MTQLIAAARVEQIATWRARHTVVIVGAGITGLVTAIRCALAGQRVVVLERGSIPNPHSTSFDQHRLLRGLAPANPQATAFAAQAHTRWLELETLLGGSQSGAGFYRRVGVVSWWPEDDMARGIDTAAEAGLRVRPVEPRQFPHLGVPLGAQGLLEVDAGVLLAQRVLRAATRWLARHPKVQLRPGSQVTAVDESSGRVELADGSTVVGDFVVVAAGPWSSKLVDLPVTIFRQTMVYLEAPQELQAWWHSAPGAGRLGPDGRAWLIPSGEGTHLKVSTEGACRKVGSVGDDVVDDDSHWVNEILTAGALVDAHRYRVVGMRTCHYAEDAQTGAGHLVRIAPNVCVRAASGGDGFRMAPLIADQIVSDLQLSSSSA